MYVTIGDLRKLEVRALDEAAQRMENAAKAYDGSPAALVLAQESERIRSLARKLEKSHGQ